MMSNLTLYQELEKLLRPQSQYTSANSVMHKNSIVEEAALRIRSDLLKLILSNEKPKANSFMEVEVLLMFDKERYQKVVILLSQNIYKRKIHHISHIRKHKQDKLI